jgi:hypothetical protein
VALHFLFGTISPFMLLYDVVSTEKNHVGLREMAGRGI